MSNPILLELPGELQNSIFFQHCDGIDRLVLRSTCRRLREIIPEPDASELFLAESSNPLTSQKDLYTCSLCAKLRHRSKFADKMMEKEMYKGGRDASSRFCLDCGFHKRYTRFDSYTGKMETVTIYDVGHFVVIGKVRYVTVHRMPRLRQGRCRSPTNRSLIRMWSATEPEYERYFDRCRPHGWRDTEAARAQATEQPADDPPHGKDVSGMGTWANSP
ncbi:hypothetical protein PG988_006475 [Apiospora saccharicola]